MDTNREPVTKRLFIEYQSLFENLRRMFFKYTLETGGFYEKIW